MTIRPITQNGNLSNIEFKTCNLDDISVIAGGYIITPYGEIIIIEDNDAHEIIFSKYINAYLEIKEEKQYNTYISTKILCELGCCVYSGVRVEYIKNKLHKLEDSMGTLTLPNNFDILTEEQKIICKKLMESNKSLLGNREKIYIQYGSFPDSVYTKEEIMTILDSNKLEKGK